MAVEWEKNEIEVRKKGNAETTQILLEGDSIVLENKPDISKIIGYQAKVKEKGIKIMQGQFIFSGELILDILYDSENGEYRIYTMQNRIPIEETIYMEDLTPEATQKIKLKTKLEHLECDMINDRKVGVRAVLRLNFHKEILQKIQAISTKDQEQIAILEKNILMEKMLEEKKDHFKMKESLTLDEKLPAFGEVLRVRGNLVEKEIRPMEEKVMIHSQMILDILYRDDENLCHVWQEKIPFHGYMESKLVTPKSFIDMELEINQIKTDTKVNEDGEARILEIEIDIEGNMEAWESMEKTCIIDAYQPNFQTELEQEEINYTLMVGEGKNQFHVREKLELSPSEPPMMQVEKTWGQVFIEEVRIEADMLEICGTIQAEIIYFSPEDTQPFYMVEKKVSFQQKTELKNILPEDEVCVKANMEDIDFQIFSEKQGELICSILLEVVGKRQEACSIVTNIEVAETPLSKLSEDSKRAGAVIYMAQQGDTLWSIAKEHHTTLEEILKLNVIENAEQLQKGEKILMMY